MKRHLDLHFRATTMCRARRLATTVAVLALLPALYGCPSGGRPALSLEEAKKATASFNGQIYTAPPRTADDVLQALREFRDSEAANKRFETAKKQAEADVPTGASSMSLTEFYFDRGSAANTKFCSNALLLVQQLQHRLHPPWTAVHSIKSGHWMLPS